MAHGQALACQSALSEADRAHPDSVQAAPNPDQPQLPMPEATEKGFQNEALSGSPRAVGLETPANPILPASASGGQGLSH